MGIFNSLFGSNGGSKEEPASGISWIPLTDVGQFDEIKEKSKGKTQIVFKHSSTCGISSMVLRMFTQQFSLAPEQADLYFLDLHAYRSVSNEVAIEFQVLHQSPQLLIIRNGVVVQHASHSGINDISLSAFV